MKNFLTDSVLKTGTIISYILVYVVVVYSIYNNIQISVRQSFKPLGITGVSVIIPTSLPTKTIPHSKTVSQQPSLIVPTNVPSSPTPSSTPATVDSRCIISINGVSYDVTQFRFIHSGGDIFSCGSDMTAIFYGQHNDGTLRRMQQYKI